MNLKFGIPMFFVAIVLAEPGHASDWLSMCVTTGKAGPVHIKTAKTGRELAPLKSGDLIYQMSGSRVTDNQTPTLAFREGQLTSIIPGMQELEKKHLVSCYDEPKSTEYPLIVRENTSEAQLIYDEFGFTSDFIIEPNKLKLGEHSRCPVSTDMFVASWKGRELESKGVSLARFCAAMTNNSWFWFDPETGQRRADYQMSVSGGLGAQCLFKPIPCFLSARTRADLGRREVRPDGCVFRYNPLTGKPISEEEGRALAKLAVFAFGPGERGGTTEDPERLGQQLARRISLIKIKVIKAN